jgi:sugar fermentation stimulation protein A
MRFSAPLIPATLKRRYKRFLADVTFADGSETTAHVANPGSMLGLMTPGARVWLSKSDNPKRKLGHSWELVEADFGGGPELVGVNTAHPNLLVAEALAAGRVPGVSGYARHRREVRYGSASRVDFVLEADGEPPCYLEVKNVHMMRTRGRAEFPDAVTARGTRHLEELAAEAGRGSRAVMLFLVQIGSAEGVALARDIDPTFGKAFDRALAAGVEAIALRCQISTDCIEIVAPIPVLG